MSFGFRIFGDTTGCVSLFVTGYMRLSYLAWPALGLGKEPESGLGSALVVERHFFPLFMIIPPTRTAPWVTCKDYNVLLIAWRIQGGECPHERRKLFRVLRSLQGDPQPDRRYPIIITYCPRW